MTRGGAVAAGNNSESDDQFKFEWGRVRVFDKLTCVVLFERC